MACSQTIGGLSRPGRVLGPSLDKIIKNVAWRKHSNLVQACKSAIDKLQTLEDLQNPNYSSCIPLFSPSDAGAVLEPLILALESGSVKIIEPALECLQKLISNGLIYGEVEKPDNEENPPAIFRVLDSVCKCLASADEALELGSLKTILILVRSGSFSIRGDFLVRVVKNCYNVYLGSTSGVNQLCAKALLAQIMVIMCARMEADSVSVKVKPVSVSDILEFSDKSLSESSLVQFVQNFINGVIEGGEGCLGPPPSLNVVEGQGLSPTKHESAKIDVVEVNEGEKKWGNGKMSEFGEGDLANGNETEDMEGSKIREDVFLLFKTLCKFSMKFSTQDNPEDHLLIRGKVLSLELLKVMIDNACPYWRTDERFLNGIKQFLCLSLLKNSALSVMSVFQLLCSIFASLLSRFRLGLKAEIGIFFPILVLRILENVLQPSFLQKMRVLKLLEKMCEDPQIIIDIFVNYDCDVESPNIFERIVNGLVKTALGVPPGSATTLTPAQDIAFRIESIKCLVGIIEGMGTWMDHQLRITDVYQSKNSDVDSSGVENGAEGTPSDLELHSETVSETSEAATLEQRRAYKLELQKGISLFNRKPSKGIEFLMNSKKIGRSPEEVALFLKNTAGLNGTMIGDYLGEREDFSLKVMHAYVDTSNFEGMNFGEAIRFFLQGFRLPGEAQKIDRIMEKFAERYCKCNPNSFTSADTAYVLAYSVIMLNTDAHNNMVKNKMSKADFIRNNRGIDDGKDLPEEYLGSLYDNIVKNEIKMNADTVAPQNKQANSVNKLLGLDSILNLVTWKQVEEKPLGTSDTLLRHIQEQFKAKAGKSECVYYAVTDVAILRFMVEVCWAPMMVAFSVTLDQSDDKIVTFQCLQGFRHAVHVTAVMSMQTQRDAFVTSVAKFTYLHCAADMKQKNVDAVKAIISIAIEDGNYLQEAWEHILTCLSRFEHLQLLGEGAPPDASFFAVPQTEVEEKPPKSPMLQLLKKKGPVLQNPSVVAVARGGSYDSTALGLNASGMVTPEQINNLMSNLNLLEQIGTFELNHIFAHSQRLNSEAIVAFVKALCKVSIAELQSPTEPRVFSLTKIVEIAHYNMNRIRLVWNRIWNVLSDFFVAVGCSENLSVAIFVMDSLRQLSMKFLEREELANYNFQNEFLRPFVTVMQKSGSAEIRELIVRCVSQMVLVRVNNVKSGWKSVFMVFTTAAADERKNIVQLAFETIEKIVREYFPYITETETTTFTDCVKCLITFTNSRFNSDVSLNAIAFLRFCAVKLAEGGLICYEKSKDLDSPTSVNGDLLDKHKFTEKDEYVYYWVPLLTGLSKLTSDPRSAIRKSALEVLFDILRDHGHLFSLAFWIRIFRSIVFPIFNNVPLHRATAQMNELNEDSWSSETCAVAAQLLVDLFVKFFIVLRSLLPNIVAIVTSLMKSPHQRFASVGIAAFVRLASNLGSSFSEKDWESILMSFKESAASTIPEYLQVVKCMSVVEIPDTSEANSENELFSDQGLTWDLVEDESLRLAANAVAKMKAHVSVQLLVVQVITELYKAHRQHLSAANILIFLEVLSSIATHAHEVNSNVTLNRKLQKVASYLEESDPPVLHFENELHQNYLNFLQLLLTDNPSLSQEIGVESRLVSVCVKILEQYLNCADSKSKRELQNSQKVLYWLVPLGSSKKEELAARTPLVVISLKVLSNFERESFTKYLSLFFPLLVDLIRCEHSSGEVQRILSDIFQSSIGPILMHL
ncbi:brefeldin A-inhibited guanine nucleotide-exchange protein 1 [Amborella trichopoda]|uniref:brefeldin A-inhibited guanine nucleotide-exchange protein 1 n=1 Tax=Amborella trichopoda TaxID=13333 RepID=UPI0005D370EA|nr:brefeldin A-inhibited guanine nucleotide-exchange protein 1 [Amborella trichopoda]|eukprot:XP_011625421.1 brefeldin A-inhibited guanine nucleotide-exchange protein 1 [Amborella trichopoda]